jgi:hypothetical protein
MPTYTASGQFPATAGANSYRLEITAITSEVTGGTRVDIYAQVVKFQTHGTVTTSGTGGRSWNLPGGRSSSTSGPSLSSGSSSWSYSFARTAPLTVGVYFGFSRYIPYSYGSSTTLSISANGVGSGFLTSRTVSVNVPLFSQPVPQIPSPPTSISASTNRTDGILISWSGASGTITSYGVWWGPTPTASSNPDFTVFTSATSGSVFDSGAPVGSRNYWVRSQSSAGNSAWVPTNGVTGTRLAPAPVFSDTTVTGNWVVGKNYNTASDRTVFASNTTSYSLAAPTSGTFPLWLSINSSGQLSGTPPSSGTFTFRVSATGPGGTTTSSNISIVVHEAISWIDETLADGIVGVPYSDSVSAANATSYSLTPAFNLSTSGLSFNAVSATIAGTPKEIRSYTFTIVASNPGDSLSKEFTLNFRSGGKRFENGVAQIITNKKRYDVATDTWVDILNAKRWNAATNQWLDISN